jgi:hypothetical protein
MAQRTIVELTDDLDGGKAEETISFRLDGTNYEIDLSKANAVRFRETTSQYVRAARRAGGTAGGRGRQRQRGAGGSAGQTAAVRKWAAANGHKVSSRGRISASVQAAYEAAQS